MAEKGSGAVLDVASNVVLEYEGEQTGAIVEEISKGGVKLKLKGGDGMIQFKQGSPIRVKYWNPVGVYFLTGTVAADASVESGHLEVQISGEPVALQRRGASRLKLPLPFSFQVIEAASEAIPRGKSLKAETHDISGTGLSFDSVLPLKAPDELELVLHISSSQDVNISATVVSSERIMRNNRPTNAIRIIFADMSQETRQEIMQVVVRADSSEAQ